jgi:putative transposase
MGTAEMQNRNFLFKCARWSYKSPGQAQRFLAAYGSIAQHFRPRRHRLSAPAYRQEMRNRFQIWQEITTLALAA